MKKIALISCVSVKLSQKAKAKNLYISTLFKLNLRFAKKLNPDKICILSAKHGLLDLNDKIGPYNVTLNKMTVSERKSWSRKVLGQLDESFNLKKDHFIILAGERYRQYLVPEMTSCEIPLKGFTIGKQLQYLTRKVGNE